MSREKNTLFGASLESLDGMLQQPPPVVSGNGHWCPHHILLGRPGEQCGTCLSCNIVKSIREYDQFPEARVLLTTKKGSDGETDVLEIHALYVHKGRYHHTLV